MKLKITPEMLSVLGCFLLYGLLSTFYMYGTLYPYLASYLRNCCDNTVTTPDIELILLLDPLAQGTAIALSPSIQKRFPEKPYCIIVISLFSLMWLIASYLRSYVAFMIVLGICLGFIKGLLYLVPLYNG
jgi:hypothetical protein